MKPAHISHRTEEMPTKLQIFEEQQATKTIEFPITPSLILTATYTSVKIIKNEVGCRDDTVPKTVETRRHCEED